MFILVRLGGSVLVNDSRTPPLVDLENLKSTTPYSKYQSILNERKNKRKLIEDEKNASKERDMENARQALKEEAFKFKYGIENLAAKRIRLEKKGRKERTSSQSASKKINIFQPSFQECYECGYVTSTVELLKIHRAEEHYDLHD